MTPYLTPKEYAERGGSDCPCCGSKEIHATSHNLIIEHGALSQNVKCCDCGGEWTEEYTVTLTGYTL